jgi:hypothetical protein
MGPDVDANDMGRRSIVPRHCAADRARALDRRPMIYANIPPKYWKIAKIW